MNSDFKILLTPSEILQNVNAIIYLFNVESKKYIWSNGKYRDIIGYKEINELTFHEFIDDYVHKEDKIVIKERFDYFKEKKAGLWNGAFRVKHNRGHYIWMYSKVQSITKEPSLLLGVSFEINNDFIPIEQFVKKFKEHINNSLHPSKIGYLTKREIEIVKLIALGKSYKEIAADLSIKPDTVNKHRKHIFEKIDVHNSAALIAFCFKNGLL